MTFSFVVLPLTLYSHSFPHKAVHKQSVLFYAVQNDVLLQPFSHFVLPLTLYLHCFPHMTVHKQSVLIYAVQHQVLLQPFLILYCLWFCICTVSHTWQYISKESLFMQYKTMYCYSLLFLFPCLPLLWNIFFFPQTKKMGWCPDTFWCCPSLTGPIVYIMGSTQK